MNKYYAHTACLSFFFTIQTRNPGLSHAFSTISSTTRTRYLSKREHRMEMTRMESAPQAITSQIEIPPTDIINNILYPESKYNERMKIGRDAQFDSADGSDASILAIDANDPRLTFTYHEFPLRSMDELMDLAIQEFEAKKGFKPRIFVDLGSGCGRCVLYAALAGSGGNENHQTWDEVHGIEISSLMHDYAVDTVVQKGVDEGHLQRYIAISEDDDDAADLPISTKIYFHCGAATDLKRVLSQADIIFCYSTVFDDEGFNADIGAMILSKEWSLMLADVCREGTAVVTTDRALNPAFGWKLKHTLEVDNPSLLQSTGYVSIKE